MPARHTYTLNGDSAAKPIELRLRRWSIAKYAAFVKEIGETFRDVGGQIDSESGANVNYDQIANVIVELGDQTLSRVVRMVRESIETPELTDDEIREWMPEDFIGVVTKICEINLNDSLIKNLHSLKTIFKAKFNKEPSVLTRKSSKT